MIDISIFSGLPDWLIVLLLAAAPVVERFSLPIAYQALHMSLFSGVLLSVLGNLVPVLLVYGVGEAWIAWVERRRGILHRLTDWVLGRSHHHFSQKYEKYGLLALLIFVAVPLPLTGAWSGALAAFIFSIPFKLALPIITAGSAISYTIIALAISGAVSLFRVFL
jgi:uncharacterized membrane protein